MSETETPSIRLATEIVDSLITAGLVRTEKRDTVIANIASGGMKGGDWKNEIDFATDKGGAA